MVFKPYMHKSCARQRFVLKRETKRLKAENSHFRGRVMMDNLRFRRNIDERDRLLAASEAKIQKLENKMADANEATRRLEEAMSDLKLKDDQLKARNAEIARMQSEMVSANDLDKFEDQLTANETELGKMRNQMADAIVLKDRQLEEAMAKLKLKVKQLKARNDEVAQLQCSLMAYEDELQENVNKSEGQLKPSNIEAEQPPNSMAAANEVQRQLGAKDAKIKSLETKLSHSQRNVESWNRQLKRSHERWSKTMEERDKFVAEMRQKDKEIEELKAKLKQVDSKKQQEEADRQLAMMLAYDESGDMDFDIENDNNFDRGYDLAQFDESAMEEVITFDAQQAQEEMDHQPATSLTHDESYDADFDMEDTPDASNDKIYDANYYKEQCRVLQDIFNESIGEIWELKAQLEQANSEINKLQANSDHGYDLSILGNGSGDTDVGNFDHGYDSPEALKTAYDAAIKEIDALKLENRELKANSSRGYDSSVETLDKPVASDAFDPSTIVKPELPSFCLTWGQKNQNELDAGLLKKLPRKFEAYCDRNDGVMAYQTNHAASFDELLPHEKLIFDYFFHLFIQLLQDFKAKACFKMTRTDVIRACVKLANLKNIPTYSNDCWAAGDHLYERSKFNRPNLHLSKGISSTIAARVVVQLLYGFDSLHGNNLEAEHYCGFGNCLIHVCPATPEYNKSRQSCHKYGCRAWCQHEPIPCQFQREGQYLPCRNDPGLEKCIKGCELKCFKDVNQVKYSKAVESRNKSAGDIVQGDKFDNRDRGYDKKAAQVEEVQQWIGQQETFYADGDIFTYTRANNAMLNFNNRTYSLKNSGANLVADLDKYNANYKCSKAKTGCRGKARTRKIVTPGQDWDLEENGFEVTETGEHTC